MEIMLNDIKTTSIDTFQKIFESNIESSMKKSFSEIENKIKEDITTNIMKQIRGDDTYNYSLIPEIKITIKDPDCYTGYYCDLSSKPSEKFKTFMIMKDNEKIVYNYYEYIILTNYGKLWCYTKNNTYIYTNEHKFWIPIDYINIFRTLITENIKFIDSNSNNYSNLKELYDNLDKLFLKQLYDNLDKLLADLKTSLYSRKVVPSYIKEENENMKLELAKISNEKEQFIIEKNKQMSLELEKNCKEKEAFITEKDKIFKIEQSKMNLELEKHHKEKAKFDLDIIPYIDLINDKKQLEKDRLEQFKYFEAEKQKLAADRVLQSQKLEADRLTQLKQFETEKQKLLDEHKKIIQLYDDKTKIQETEYVQFKDEKAKFQMLILKYKKDKTDLQEEKQTFEKEKITFRQEKEAFTQEKIKAYSLNEEI